MSDVYNKYFYNKLNRLLLLCTVIGIMAGVVNMKSIRVYDYFLIMFLPISYYSTFYRNRVIDDIVPISNREKFRKNFIVWSSLGIIYTLVCFILMVELTSGDWGVIHNWFVELTSAVAISTVIVAIAICKEKTGVGIITSVVVFVVIVQILGFISNGIGLIITDLFRILIIVISTWYSFENIESNRVKR